MNTSEKIITPHPSPKRASPLAVAASRVLSAEDLAYKRKGRWAMVLAVPLLGLAVLCGVLYARGNLALDVPTFFLGCFGVVALLSAIWPKVMLRPREGDEDDSSAGDDGRFAVNSSFNLNSLTHSD